MNFEQARFHMIEQQIRPWGVLSTAVLEQLALIKREDFVLPAYRTLAFSDTELPIGYGQTMLSPKVEGRILNDLQISRHERVLEIGAGSGYLSALLGSLGQTVTSLEIAPELAQLARSNLQKAGIHNVRVLQACGTQTAEDGPFDVIVLGGSVAMLPQQLLAQLKPGGRLFAVVGGEPVMRATLVKRDTEGSLTTETPWDTVAPRLANFAELPGFSF